MTSIATRSNSTTRDSRMERLVRDKFALLARVGHQKRKALASLEEMEFYYGIATELLALLVEAVELLQVVEKAEPALSKHVGTITSRQHHLIRKILRYWPPGTESQERILNLLDLDGLEKVLGTTPDGYVTLSGGLILENVARIIGATREQAQNQSSGSEAQTTSHRAGTSGSANQKS